MLRHILRLATRAGVAALLTVPAITHADDDAPFYINPGLNDAWLNTDTPGQGFLLTVYPGIDSVFLAWFTFDDERPPDDVMSVLGEPGHRWLTAQGAFAGDTAELTVYSTEGGVFDMADPPAVTDPAGVGTLTLEFADCTQGMVTYDLPSAGLSGAIPITRITDGNVPLCEALAEAAIPACTRPEPDISHGVNDPVVTSFHLVPPTDIVDGGVGPDGIPALDNPSFEGHPGPSTPDPQQLVVGIRIGDQVRAYPHDILDWHEIINDTFLVEDEPQPLSLSYCPLTGTAMLWKPFDYMTNPTFGTSGTLYYSNLVLYDRETKTLWSQMLEQGIRGLNVTDIPERLPVVETTWETWSSMYPGTRVLSRDTGYSRDYDDYPYDNYREDNSILFPVPNLEDGRLHRKQRVLGINVGDHSKVYPIGNFANGIEVLNDRVGNMDVVVAGSKDKNLGVVFNRQLEDCTVLDFESVQGSLPVVMRDSEGNEWDLFGEAVSGPRKGEQLEKTNSYVAYWFAWTAFFPGSEIHP